MFDSKTFWSAAAAVAAVMALFWGVSYLASSSMKPVSKPSTVPATAAGDTK